MRPEQERVKNLLSDTVTLLCKNGLTYKDELRVEALIGITLDNSDVFIVHINEKFDSKGDKSGGEDILSPESAKQEVFSQTPSATGESLPESNSPTDEGSRKNDILNEIQAQGARLEECPKPSRSSVSDVGSDRADSSSTVKELAALEHSNVVIKIEDEEIEQHHQQGGWGDVQALKSPDAIAQRALMIAGQRRAPLKRPYMTAQQCHDAEAMRQTYSTFNLTDSANKNNGKMWGEMEPPVKRQNLDDYYLVPTEHGEMAAQMMFDPNNSQLLSPDGSRAGCSSWSSGGATPRTGLQSDMMALLGSGGGGGGSEARYPTLSGLQSHAHRQLLATHLVDPVLNADGQMCAFRLSWYGKAGCDLDSAWSDIVAHQKHCDRIVTSFPGVAVVGSAFTGTVSGLKKGENGASRRTYPGLSYFVVPGGDDFVYPNLLSRMEQNNLGAIMKPMLGLHEQTRPKLCSALYLVFKDNVDSGYVQRMVDISAGALGELGEDPSGCGRHYPMVRFSVRGDDHWPCMVEAHAKLQEAGFKASLNRIDD